MRISPNEAVAAVLPNRVSDENKNVEPIQEPIATKFLEHEDRRGEDFNGFIGRDDRV